MINYIKANRDCSRVKLYNFTCSMMKKIGLNELLYNQVSFTNWFHQFIRRNCVEVNENVQLKVCNPSLLYNYKADPIQSNISLQIPARNLILGNGLMQAPLITSRLFFPLIIANVYNFAIYN